MLKVAFREERYGKHDLTLKQLIDLADLAYEIAHDIETRAEYADLVKRVDPNRAKKSFRDIEILARIEALEGRMTALEKE